MEPFSANNMAAPRRCAALPYHFYFHHRVKTGLVENLNSTHEELRKGAEGWKWRTRDIREKEEKWVVRGKAMIGFGCGSGAGRALPVSAPSVPVKFYRSSGERAGGAARNRRTFKEDEAAIHGMWHTLRRHIWLPTHPVSCITHSWRMIANSVHSGQFVILWGRSPHSCIFINDEKRIIQKERGLFQKRNFLLPPHWNIRILLWSA